MTKENMNTSYSMNDCQQRKSLNKDDTTFCCPKTNSSSSSFEKCDNLSFLGTGDSVLENMMIDQRKSLKYRPKSNGVGALSNGSIFEGKQSAPTQTMLTNNIHSSNRTIRRMSIMDRLRQITFPSNSLDLMESMDGTNNSSDGNRTNTASPTPTDSTTTTEESGDYFSENPLPFLTADPDTPITQIPRSTSSSVPIHDLRSNPTYHNDAVRNGGFNNGLFLRNGTNLTNLSSSIPLRSIDAQIRRIEELNDPTNLQQSYYRSNEMVDNNNGNAKEYPVRVDIKDCNLTDGNMCGYLTIHNLTTEYKSLTTFFDAEIIGCGGNGFLTKKWSADISIDKCHWNRFEYFRERFGDIYLEREDWVQKDGGDSCAGGGGGNDGNSMNDYDNNIHQTRQQIQLQTSLPPDLYRDDVIFMRWKERFLVPDYRVDNIPGASYAGFYYMAYDKESNNLEGYYYHKDANQIAIENGTTIEIQKLDLKHKPRMTSSFYEFM